MLHSSIWLRREQKIDTVLECAATPARCRVSERVYISNTSSCRVLYAAMSRQRLRSDSSETTAERAAVAPAAALLLNDLGNISLGRLCCVNHKEVSVLPAPNSPDLRVENGDL